MKKEARFKFSASFIVAVTLIFTPMKSFSSDGFESVDCAIKLKSIVGDISDKYKLDDTKKAELERLIGQDPDLAHWFSNKDVVEYIYLVALGKPISELEAQIYKIWDATRDEEKNLKMRQVAKPELVNIFKNLENVPVAKQGKLRFHLSRFFAQFKQFPKTFKKLKALVDNELHPSTLDSRVWDFYGYLNLKLDSSRLRQWNSVDGSFNAIMLKNVVGLDPATFTKVAMLSSEIEMPINAYSDNSGEVLRVVSPQASRFMGKTAQEAEAHKLKKARTYCTNSWCFEENRHEGALAQMARGIMGFELPSSVQFQAYPNLSPLRLDDAFFHLIARNDTEWHAASAYFYLGAHSDGALAQWVANVRQDEIKHMSIFGGLYKYLMGDTYNQRLRGMLKKMIAEIKEKNTNSEYGSGLTYEPLSLLEIAYTHIVYEKNIRRFFKSLPIKTLRKIYETPVNLAPLAAVEMDPTQNQQIESMKKLEESRRRALARWPEKQRKEIAELENFEILNNALLTKIIIEKFNSFAGVGEFESPSHKNIQLQIRSLNAVEIESQYGVKLSANDMSLLIKSLLDTVRDYQIMNNQQVVKLGLKVKLIDAVSGFDIIRDSNYDALKKAE